MNIDVTKDLSTEDIEILFIDFSFFLRVGTVKSFKIELRTREDKRHLPHVHISGRDYDASVRIDTGDILAGTLPKRHHKDVKKWVLNNKKFLLNKWNEILLAN